MDTGRLLVLAAGVAGAFGVGLAAASSHLGGGNIQIASNFLLFHAPALLAIGLFGRSRMLELGGAALVLGLLLFCGDLAIRHFVGWRVLPLAAPAGGLLLIGGWVTVALSGFTMRR